MAKVLIVAVHPDDETLGAGGTLLRHIKEGDEVHWLIVTTLEGVDWGTPAAVELKRRQIEEVSQAYGFASVIEFKWKTTKLDEMFYSEQVQAFEKLYKSLKPEIVYLPHGGDIHSDHRRVYDVASICTKSFRYPEIKQVYTIEVASETDQVVREHTAFHPNHFVDISDTFEKKIEILKIYSQELGTHPFPRNIDNLRAWATMRGAQVNFKFAEAFVCLKYRR